MRSHNFKFKPMMTMMLGLGLAMGAVSGCSQNNQDRQPMAQNGDSAVTTTRVVDGQVVTQTDSRHTSVQPLPQNGQLADPFGRTGATGNPDGSGYNAYGSDGDRTVHVRAPMVNLNVDRDSGSVHLNTPFVHINKTGRGQGTEIDIPRMHVDTDQGNNSGQ